MSFIENSLKPDLRKWAGDFLSDDIVYSGSTAKGTAITFCSDVDIFVPFKNNGSITLEGIYEALFRKLILYSPRKQNVSIGIMYAGYKIDIVPGRVQNGYKNYYSLYKSKTRTWTQTNLKHNIDIIRTSGRINEIIALKIWRYRNNLDISSTLLEFIVLNALKNQRTSDIAENVLKVLSFLSDDLLNVKIIDPTNSNNVLTDDLSYSEKKYISSIAYSALKKDSWGGIIW